MLPCPCCKKAANSAFSLPYSGLGESCFNKEFTFYVCPVCGFIFNPHLTESELARFYAQESFYKDLNHFDASHPINILRYQFFYRLIRKYKAEQCKIADIGCGQGGFVRYLNTFPGIEAVGVDYEAIALNAMSTSTFFVNGTATALPFSESTFDILTYFHVFEHVLDLDEACCQAYATLNSNGVLLLEVPDAENYDVIEGANSHWYASREHIHHFTKNALQKLLERHGFTVQETITAVLPAIGFLCTSLFVLATKRDIPRSQQAEGEKFFKSMQLRLQERADALKHITQKYDRIVIWGLGSVFFSLIPYIYEDIKEKLVLVDGSPNKQRLVYRENPILAPTSIFPQDNWLCIIGSTISHSIIQQAAENHGWKPDNILPIC
ncbi:MAG: hypothetical protein DELT_01467 [Desulfovibrio sp.]